MFRRCNEINISISSSLFCSQVYTSIFWLLGQLFKFRRMKRLKVRLIKVYFRPCFSFFWQLFTFIFKQKSRTFFETLFSNIVKLRYDPREPSGSYSSRDEEIRVAKSAWRNRRADFAARFPSSPPTNCSLIPEGFCRCSMLFKTQFQIPPCLHFKSIQILNI